MATPTWPTARLNCSPRTAAHQRFLVPPGIPSRQGRYHGPAAQASWEVPSSSVSVSTGCSREKHRPRNVCRAASGDDSEGQRPALGNSLFESRRRKAAATVEVSDLDIRPPELELPRESSDSGMSLTNESGAEEDQLARSMSTTRQKPVDLESALRSLDLALAADDLSAAMLQVEGSLEAAPLEVVSGSESRRGLFEERAAQVLNLALQETDMEQVLRAYGWLTRVGVLKGFGREKEALVNAQPRLVTPDTLRRLTGLEASRLSPKKFGSNPLGPLAAIGIFSALVNNGIDIRPLALIILGLGIVDSVYLGGAGQAQIMSLWPGYKKRVLVHEAGHVVVAYLLGCPVRGVILDAFTAADMGIQGQAGTQFWDSSLDRELKEGRLTGATVDRYSVVLFAGIAAEALIFGEAEGGESDENLFKALVGNLQPEWPSAKVSNQARWAVGQACTILRSQRKALLSVVDVLERDKNMSDVALAIESSLV